MENGNRWSVALDKERHAVGEDSREGCSMQRPLASKLKSIVTDDVSELFVKRSEELAHHGFRFRQHGSDLFRQRRLYDVRSAMIHNALLCFCVNGV